MRARLLLLCGLVVLTVAIATPGWFLLQRRRARMPVTPDTVLAAYPDPPGIVLHSSESPAVVHGVPINAASLERIHAHDHPTWATLFEGKIYHIGYHYVILPDGTVEQGRPDHCPGCHAPHFNNYLGICVIGCFDPSVPHHWRPSRPTQKQIASLLSLCERLMTQYHIPPENVLRHSDTRSTYCPGRRFPFRSIKRSLTSYVLSHPETRPLQVRPALTAVPSSGVNPRP